MRFDWLFQQRENILTLLGWHIYLSVIPVLIGLALAIPVGGVLHRCGKFKDGILNLLGLLYTIPSLALFVLLPGLLGTKILDVVNVVVALTLYAFALLIRTVCDGLDSVADDTRQAAVAMGYRPLQRFLSVELPLAVPVIAAGMRVVVVSNVSIVSISALVGMPQLGALFTQGFQLHFLTPIIAGIFLCIVLALLLDNLVLRTGNKMTTWQPKRNAK
ncbi:ABC transporter permease subunit [Rahnella sp. C60]|uniref:ABC transporter permease subunit n=1 Tax=Rahnella perminowiae TaxID=2816244 RepID=A0ABS6L322_9GAMM|nr:MULTISPECIES: ABC transporter permease subunit [Rahnella]UJD89537.1 ABC transporter permease subunit [Rahnella aquatilis]MBU9811063.1 ABC transporter permease subunit [Rahnella perminowiae]MBU9817453.1 ABC transporter permease subunit [Rahnella perminowiae]MBU9825380.1 ABC transporter permease subunit [Rahnella perminowiae]MBU9836255.1 ABC transporter permease subunit [Rahnella perminowiae]